MKTISLFLGILFLPLVSACQFELISQDYGINIHHENTEWGNGASFYDFNHDGWDDLTTANGDSAIQFFQNDGYGMLNQILIPLPSYSYAQVKAIIWVDYDNDGDSDLFITQYGGRLFLYNNSGDFVMEEATQAAGLPITNYKYYGASFADVNNDGFLDFYVSKYYNPITFPAMEYSSLFFMNNGNGTFSNQTLSAGLLQPPSPSFQSVFFDYNNDGFLDLYIIVDRSLWPNELFKNNGDGTFTEVSDLLGAAIGVDSMCASPGDFDNDSDFDVFITDGPTGNVFLQNNYPNNFQNIASAFNLTINKSCWGSNWLDVDNDGWQDLFVATTVGLFTSSPNAIFKNNEGLSFTETSQLWGIGSDNSPTMCNVIGDINNDGNFDYFNNNNYPAGSDLWRSSTSSNNFLAITLEGTLSNRDAIGTKVVAYFDGNVGARLKSCGEAYLAQNSGQEIFGLGAVDVVDTLAIFWPSGLVEKYYNIVANHKFHFIEGNASATPFELSINDFTICPGQEIILDGGEALNWLWNTGYNGRYLTVSEPGEYHLQYTDENSIIYMSNAIEIELQLLPTVETSSYNPTCFGYSNGFISFDYSYEENSVLLVNDEAITSVLQNIPAGEYNYQLIAQSGCETSGTVQLFEPQPLSVDFSSTNPTCFGEFGTLVLNEIVGGSGNYIIEYFGEDPNQLEPGEFQFLVLDEQGCPFVGNYEISQPEELILNTQVLPQIGEELGSISIEVAGGTGNIVVYINGIQTALQNINVEAGTYTIDVMDENGCTLTEEVVVEFHVSVAEIRRSFEVYPNPASEYIILELFNSEMLHDVEIYSSTGALIYCQKINSFKTKIEISNWSEGIYLVHIGDEEFRFVKQ